MQTRSPMSLVRAVARGGAMTFGQYSVAPFLVTACLGFAAPPASAELTWGNQGQKCDGPHKIEYARLWGLQLGTDWKRICERTKASNISPLSNGKIPSYCVDKGGLGTWGEWKYSNHPSCKASFEPVRQAGCFGPSRQVYSAKLIGDTHGKSWEDACRTTDGPNKLGKPARCVKGAFNTGIWGEWYSNERCAKPLDWGAFKDNGCVEDMKVPDANSGGISLHGMRSYSSVLWNVGGDWLEACRQAAVDERLPNGVHLRSNVPTSCVIANANEALSWTVTAILGAGTAFIAPAGARAVVTASTGAAVALASKGAEELLLGAVDTSLNVWGIFWVVDARCGTIDTTSRLFVQTADAGGSPGNTPIGVCPETGDSIRSATTCTCSPAQTGSGQVWGSGTYTSDSSICRAAVHAGVISTQGGNVAVRPVGGRRSYESSSRNGVTTTRYGRWKASFELE